MGEAPIEPVDALKIARLVWAVPLSEPPQEPPDPGFLREYLFCAICIWPGAIFLGAVIWATHHI